MKGFKMFKRKIMILFLILVMSFSSQAFAYTITYNMYYLSAVDQYRMDFNYPTGTATYGMHFIGSSGTPYDTTYTTLPTGVFYLTCNGTYAMYFYDANGSKIGSFDNIQTSQIMNGSCSSYSGVQTGKNDLNVVNNGTTDGTNYGLSWTPRYTGTTSQVYKDGQLVQDNASTSYTGPKGSYTIFEKQNGSVVSQSDINVPNYDGTGGTAGSGDISLKECADQICSCIQSLKPVLDQINTNTGGILNKMSDVIQAVNDVKTSVDDIKNQLTPANDYPIDTVTSKSLPTLEDNKPLLHETGKFEDTTTHFSDQGDAPEPSMLPAVPEPTTVWKDQNGNDVQQQSKLERSPTLQRAPVMTRDIPKQRTPVLQQDKTDYREKLRWISNQYP